MVYNDRFIKGKYRVIVEEKKDESFFIWNFYLLYEYLNNLFYSLEMLNEIVERGCNECFS